MAELTREEYIAYKVEQCCLIADCDHCYNDSVCTQEEKKASRDRVERNDE